MKKFKTRLKTHTLGYRDNPTMVVCLGHVDAKTFTAAFLNEWVGDAVFKQEHLRYVYARGPKKGKAWKTLPPTAKGALPYTEADWDN